jgi:hypothetical protein
MKADDTLSSTRTCPLCQGPSAIGPIPVLGGGTFAVTAYDCPSCGEYRVTDLVRDVIREQSKATRDCLIALAAKEGEANPGQPFTISEGELLHCGGHTVRRTSPAPS